MQELCLHQLITPVREAVGQVVALELDTRQQVPLRCGIPRTPQCCLRHVHSAHLPAALGEPEGIGALPAPHIERAARG